MADFKVEFGERLTKRAEELGQDAPSIANALGTSRQVVDHWLKGRSIPRPQMLVQLARHLGVTVAYLKRGEVIYPGGVPEKGMVASKSAPGSTISPERIPEYGLRPEEQIEVLNENRILRKELDQMKAQVVAVRIVIEKHRRPPGQEERRQSWKELKQALGM